MARRVCAFALVLVVAGAHVAASVCQVTCRSHDAHATADDPHRHSHHPPARAPGATMSSAAHTCDHQIAAASAIQPGLHSLKAPAAVTGQAFASPRAGYSALLPLSTVIDESPPGLLALTAQLRV